MDDDARHLAIGLDTPAVEVGSRVETVRPRPVTRGSLITLEAGDAGTVVRAAGRAHAVDFGGVVAIVARRDVRLLL